MTRWDDTLFGFDVETTGTDPLSDRILTAALVRLDAGRVTRRREWVLDHGIDVPVGASRVNGLTKEFLRRHGSDPGTAIRGILSEVRSCWERGPLVVYNAPFDLTILDHEAARLGLDLPVEGTVVDPLTLWRHFEPRLKGKRRLVDAMIRFGVPPGPTHEAAADAESAATVLRAMSAGWQLHALAPSDLMRRQPEWHAEHEAQYRAWRSQKGLEAAQQPLAWPLSRAPRALVQALDQPRAVVAAAPKRRPQAVESVAEPQLVRFGPLDLDMAPRSEAAIALRGLTGVDSLASLENLLGMDQPQLEWLLFGEGRFRAYDHFLIPKRSGGLRSISVPSSRLGDVQGRLRAALTSRVPPSARAHGFRPGLSIADNARQHSQAEVVVRMDLRDFFHTVKFERVVELFSSWGYGSGIATVLGLLTTEQDSESHSADAASLAELLPRGLPQGACTSPDLANLVCARLDYRLAALAASYSDAWTYTRYADDLVFSSTSSDAAVGHLVRVVSEIVHSEGFSINPGKTAVMRAPNRRLVTGLVVGDGEVRLTRDYRRRLRALLHQVERDGLDVTTERLRRDASSLVRGHLAFVNSVQPQLMETMLAQHPSLAALAPRAVVASSG